MCWKKQAYYMYVYTAHHMREHLCTYIYMLYAPLTNHYLYQKATSAGCTAYQMCVYIPIYMYTYCAYLYCISILYVLCTTIPHRSVWGYCVYSFHCQLSDKAYFERAHT